MNRHCRKAQPTTHHALGGYFVANSNASSHPLLSPPLTEPLISSKLNGVALKSGRRRPDDEMSHSSSSCTAVLVSLVRFLVTPNSLSSHIPRDTDLHAPSTMSDRRQIRPCTGLRK